MAITTGRWQTQQPRQLCRSLPSVRVGPTRAPSWNAQGQAWKAATSESLRTRVGPTSSALDTRGSSFLGPIGHYTARCPRCTCAQGPCTPPRPPAVLPRQSPAVLRSGPLPTPARPAPAAPGFGGLVNLLLPVSYSAPQSGQVPTGRTAPQARRDERAARGPPSCLRPWGARPARNALRQPALRKVWKPGARVSGACRALSPSPRCSEHRVWSSGFQNRLCAARSPAATS